MATATQRAEQQGTRGAGAEGGRCTTRGIGALDGVGGASTPLGLFPQRQPHRRWPANFRLARSLPSAALRAACLTLATTPPGRSSGRFRTAQGTAEGGTPRS